MSKYFQTLKRLQSGIPRAPATEAITGFVDEAPSASLCPFPRITLQSAKAHSAFSGLLESLRLAALNAISHSVVIAGISGDRASRHVMAGLETAAERRPLELVTGDFAVFPNRLVKLYRCSSPRNQGIKATSDMPSTERTLAVDLSDSSLPENLRMKIDQVNPKADFAVLHGPPLDQSVEAALLAGATGGGIVLVLEPLVTTRSDLILALDRSENSGCTVLGVVMLGAVTSLPRWLERALDGSAR